jgi:hypothetical protein
MTGPTRWPHRGRHQAPGWTRTLGPDGTLAVTTPTGLTASTRPPHLDGRIETSIDEPAPFRPGGGKASTALTAALGLETTSFPGWHIGHVIDPAGFVVRLREVLAEP